ncbi:hypothetical protein [Jiangella mangrovi]|uniref:Uncharacterized protein n=1 Tax=Jiangella mangrovi TaxID=1524084 RepID=A0A7W9GXQ7_9ACTN|nr:hypothetical protein [Jiangella mangrovi]MBB5791571.1 hypothetical protein [Jiangella mangrovi]
MITPPDDDERAERGDESLEAATHDLERLREHLQAAARGDTSGQELTDAVGSYWQEHEPALRLAAASLTEEARLRALAELYRWRERLATQLPKKPDES